MSKPHYFIRTEDDNGTIYRPIGNHMFTRTTPRALALAFAIVLMTTAAVVLGIGALGTATPGQDGIPATAATVTANPVAPDCSATPATATPAGVCYESNEYHGYPYIDTALYGTDVPRCASDDFNAGHVARCYTERVTDGAILVIDQSDTVIATLNH